MTTINQPLNQIGERLQHFANSIWYSLRSSGVTIFLLLILLFIFFLGLILPQQTPPIQPETAQTIWIDSLPTWLNPWGELLYFLGFAHIFHTLWFWLPLAFLLLNSLIALADYSLGSWQRFKNTLPPVEWQHPLARRVEYVARLPSSPDEYLESIKTSLQQQNYSFYASPSDQRIVGAVQRHWAWTGPLILYSSLILLIVAALISHYTLRTDQLTLSLTQIKQTPLFSGTFQLDKIEQNMGQITYASFDPEQANQKLIWQLYRPAFLEGVFILPTQFIPYLTVQIQNEQGDFLELNLLEDESSQPVKKLTMPLDQVQSFLHFTEGSIAFRIAPDLSTTNRNSYNLQAIQLSTETVIFEEEIQTGQTFEINDLSVILSIDHNVHIFAYYDPALWLYLLILLFISVGSAFTFLWPPTQLWLIPEIRGMGGQIYGVMEKLHPTTTEEEMINFLEKLLTDATRSAREELLEENDGNEGELNG